MKYIVVTSILIGLMSIGPAQSQESSEFRPGIYAGIDLGSTTVEFKSGPGFLEGGQNKLKSLSAALSVGYQWRSGFIAEARFRTTFATAANLLGIDTEELSESQYLLGYRHFVDNRYALVPMIGYSDWEIDEVTSGVFSSSGPGRVERESGNGTVVRFGVERQSKNAQSALTLYTSYSNNKEHRAFDTSLGYKLYF